MIFESIAAIGGGVLIGALVFVRGKHTKREVDVEHEAAVEWPEMEQRLRQKAVEMRIQRIAADAKLILYHQYRGSSGSRRQMKASDMSETRWENAVGLLRDLGIYEFDGNTPRLSHYHATRKLEAWERTEIPMQTQRAAAKGYVAPW